MKNLKWDSKYLHAGITALLVIFCCIVFYMFMKEWTGIKNSVLNLVTILAPFIWGFVIAYLLSPMMNFFQRNVFDSFAEKMAKTEKAKFAISRGFSIILSVIVAWLAIVTLCWIIIPKFYESIRSIITVFPEYMTAINNKILELLAPYPEVLTVVNDYLNQIYNTLIGWLTNDIQPRMTDIVSIISTSLKAVIMIVVNIFIGVIVSCYLLYNKEKFKAQLKRTLYSIFELEHVDAIVHSFRFVDRVFMGFLGGKLIDSAIIAVICYICCSLLKMPYVPLISVIIGVTNIIPYFGPFIGAVPCGFIVLMTSPIKCAIFLIFILALQLFDGNILGPKILGNSVGISGFWVMFAILVGSGLFGFAGMILGVPVFVVISTGINLLITNRLKKRGLPTETSDYTTSTHL